MINLFDDLTYALSDIDKAHTNFTFYSDYHSTLKKAKNLPEYQNIDPNLLEFYRTLSNGLELNWEFASDTTITGQMHFLPMEQVLQNWEGKLYDAQDLEHNDQLAYFHPFDLITPEAQCGIMLGMPYKDYEIYYNYSPYSETEGLDLDFRGYLEMAKETFIFSYWPKILLDIQNEEESPETKLFKQYIPQIYTDFKWETFVAKYESLRLSKK